MPLHASTIPPAPPAERPSHGRHDARERVALRDARPLVSRPAALGAVLWVISLFVLRVRQSVRPERREEIRRVLHGQPHRDFDRGDAACVRWVLVPWFLAALRPVLHASRAPSWLTTAGKRLKDTGWGEA